MLELTRAARIEVWQKIITEIESYFSEVDQFPVAGSFDPSELNSLLSSFDFRSPVTPATGIQLAVQVLRAAQVHASHPRCFGMFDPRPTTISIAAEMLVAAFNPQLAAWNMAPGPVEIEKYLIRWFGQQFGISDAADGTFTSGGQEANQTALLTALAQQFPGVVRNGLRSLPGQPVFYISSEAHHSFYKAAVSAGLGKDAVREIAADRDFRLDPTRLEMQIHADRKAGHLPFMVVATAGTTSSGAVDPIRKIAEIAKAEGLWLHTDAAWGGAFIFVPEFRPLLDGIGFSDSVTFDPHKLLAVPKGAGLFLTRHDKLLDALFGIQTAYMPISPTAGKDKTHPFSHSLQWTRRFIGLQVFLSLATIGIDGYIQAIRHQVAMAELLKNSLLSDGWEVINEPNLAVVCFRTAGVSAAVLQQIAGYVVRTGRAWISFTKIGDGIPVLRACIVNHKTQVEDLQILCEVLKEAREKISAALPQSLR